MLMVIFYQSCKQLRAKDGAQGLYFQCHQRRSAERLKAFNFAPARPRQQRLPARATEHVDWAQVGRGHISLTKMRKDLKMLAALRNLASGDAPGYP